MINAGNVYSELILNGDKYFKTLEKADRDMKSFEHKLNSYGDKMQKLGSSWTKKVSLPLAGVGAAAIKVGMDFESGMSEVSAISGATGDELNRLGDRARELAKETKFSATEAAEGLKYMSLAGWEVEEMYSALPGVLNLASAANMDLARASDIVTDTMSAFGMKATEATKASDIFAKTQASSNTSVEQLGEAMKYAGAAANAAGMDLEETNTILGMLADSGIKGSMAGTTFTAMLRDMRKAADDGNIAIGDTSVALYDVQGNMRDMSDIIYEFEQATKGMTTAQRDAALGALFGEQALKGMNIVLATGSDRYNELEEAIRNSDGAAKDMADTMQDNLKGQWESLKSSLAEVGIQLAEIMIPLISDFVKNLNEWVDWFGNLDKSTQEIIVKLGALAVAMGPVLIIGGKALKGGGAILGLLGKLTGSVAKTSSAVGGMGIQISLAGAATKASALLFNPWVLGATAAAGAGYLIYKELNQRVIPEIEIFDDTISETTQNVVGNFLDMERNVTTSLNYLSWSGKKITDEMANEIVGNFKVMKDGVVSELEEQKKDALKSLEELFINSTEITEEEKNEMIRITNEKYNQMIDDAEQGHNRITQILEDAKENNRSITQEELEEITLIKENLKEESIRLLSETQEESETILRNLKENSEAITAEMASDIIKNSIEQRDITIKNAEEEYKNRLRHAENLKKDGTKESIELADNIIKEADRQKKETIKNAEDMHSKVLKEVESQGKNILRQINLDNGEIKTKWQSLKDWFGRNPIIRRIQTITDSAGDTGSDRGPVYGRNAHGTNYWRGGLTWVGEQGPELIELPKGSKVHTNKDSMGMTSKIEHSGTIRIEGINNQNEIIAVKEIIMDELRREVRS